MGLIANQDRGGLMFYAFAAFFILKTPSSEVIRIHNSHIFIYIQNLLIITE